MKKEILVLSASIVIIILILISLGSSDSSIFHLDDLIFEKEDHLEKTGKWKMIGSIRVGEGNVHFMGLS